LAAGSLHTIWLPAVVASVLAALLVRFTKWRQLLVQSGAEHLKHSAAQTLFGGYALSVVTPGRLGEAGRCLFADAPDRAPVLLLTLLDRALDAWALVTLTAASLFWIAPRPLAVFSAAVWLAFLPLMLGLPSLIADGARLPWWSHWTHRIAPGSGNPDLGTRLREASKAILAVRTRGLAAWALLAMSLDLLTFFFLLRSFGPAPFRAAAVTFPWMAIAGDLPLSLAGFGLREGAAVFLLCRFAIRPAVALDVALLYFAVAYLLPALPAALLATFRSWGNRSQGTISNAAVARVRTFNLDRGAVMGSVAGPHASAGHNA